MNNTGSEPRATLEDLQRAEIEQLREIILDVTSRLTGNPLQPVGSVLYSTDRLRLLSLMRKWESEQEIDTGDVFCFDCNHNPARHDRECRIMRSRVALQWRKHGETSIANQSLTERLSAANGLLRQVMESIDRETEDLGHLVYWRRPEASWTRDVSVRIAVHLSSQM